MCKIYNSIGSLTVINNYLRKHNVNDFKSLNELINFQNNYTSSIQQVISNHAELIEKERNLLPEELAKLTESIQVKKSEVEQHWRLILENLRDRQKEISVVQSDIVRKFIFSIKKAYLNRKIKNTELLLDYNVNQSVKHLNNQHSKKNNRYQFIVTNFDAAVRESSLLQRNELERKKRIIDEISPFIYGALGEQKVVKVLESLSDEYFLINDFTVSFTPAIYNRQENDYIKSVQIDHLLVGPSGIFLIETKNWSEKSLESLSLRSPVLQIKRTNFALFKLLNNEMSNHQLHLDKHHWGDKKISIRNIIALTNTKPKEEFQYVKILNLNELLSYIKYFQPTFSNQETQNIKSYLLKFITTQDNMGHFQNS